MLLTEKAILEWIAGAGNYRKVRNQVARHFLAEAQHLAPIVCEYLASEAELAQMYQHIERVWSSYGEEEPHWSVVTAPQFRRDEIAGHLNEFYELGRREAGALDLLLRRNEIDLSPSGRWLEYGCGVGRVTRWLADRCARVIGVDISAHHLSLAREYCEAEGVTNADWIHVLSVADLRSLPPFDFLYSKIVLQHNPPPIIHRVLDTLLSKVEPGGVVLFQVPTYCVGYRFVVGEYLEKMDGIHALEMHVLPQAAVFNLLHKHALVPIEVFRDHLVTQANYVSNTFVAQKKP